MKWLVRQPPGGPRNPPIGVCEEGNIANGRAGRCSPMDEPGGHWEKFRPGLFSPLKGPRLVVMYEGFGPHGYHEYYHGWRWPPLQRSSKGVVFNPEDYPAPPGVMPFFEYLTEPFKVIAGLHWNYGCMVHTGRAKWASVGLVARKWFRKEWRVDIALNRNFFVNGEVFFELNVHKYVRVPVILADFMVPDRGSIRTVRTYTTEEISDFALLERDIRAVLDEELVTGKAWEF